MKKKLALSLAFAFTMGVAGTAFADSNPFVDVPKNHWSYDAVTKLAADKVIDGYGDKTFRGDKAITRYEMAQVVAKAVGKADKASAEDKALIQKLYTEYKEELKGMNVRVSSLEGDVKDLKSKVDNVVLSGFVRTKYDSERMGGKNVNSGNKHTYMDFEGKMKVNDTLDAHFQSETNKHYTNHTWGNGISGNEGSATDSDGTIQRIWVEGKVGSVGIAAGRKWWGLGPQNVAYGHAGDGVKLDFTFNDQLSASVFNIRPSQGALTTVAFYNTPNTSLYGIQLNANLSKEFTADIIAGGNHKSIDGVRPDKLKEVTSWYGADASYKFSDDWKITGTYVKTNADNDNKSSEVRVDFKGADLSKPGTFGVYVRYFNFGLQGNISHDDEWSSLHGDSKGWIFGVDYALAKNVQWTNFYSDQKMNLSGKGLVDNTAKEATKKLLRSQIDFHF